MNNKNMLYKQKGFLFIVAIFLFSVNIISAFSGSGVGTVGDPYQITNCTQLFEIDNNLTGHYNLTNDINCSDTINWEGGNGFSSMGNFTGSLNGNNYYILDLFSKYGSGLFSDGWYCNISNVKIKKYTLSGSSIFSGGFFNSLYYGKIINSSINQLNFNVNGNFIGGLVGLSVGGYIYNSSTSGIFNVKCLTNGYNVGGLTGYNYPSEIIKSFSNISIDGYCYPTGGSSGFIQIGGLTGNHYTGLITQSYSIGNINSQITPSAHNDYVQIGGLVGSLNVAYIDNSYALGNVSNSGSVCCENSVGGLVGSSNGYINMSYSTGKAYTSGDTFIYRGGLTGRYSGLYGHTTNNSFWDINSSNLTTSSSGTGRNTTYMKDIQTFTNKTYFPFGLNISWDFTNIWGISPLINNGYPYLLQLGGYSISSLIFINLTNPTNNYYFNYTDNVYLNFMVNSSNELDTCELWGNFTGNWNKNYTWETVYSGNLTNTSLNLLDGYYLWNVWCNDSLGNSNFSLTNYTFGVDTLPPIIEGNVSYATSQNTIYFTTNISDAFYCYYNITYLNGTINGNNQNISFVCNQLSSGSTMGFGNFTMIIYAYDKAWNFINQSFNFTTTYVPSGGGGGTSPPEQTQLPVVFSKQPVLTAGNWTIETELGGNKYQFFMIQGSLRTKSLLFENLGTNERIITLTCNQVSGERDLCEGISFQQNTFNLPVQKGIKTSIDFNIKILGEYEKGKYIVNLVAIDEANNLGIITLEVDITSKQSITGVVTKLFSNTERNIPYFLFFLLVAFMTGVLSHFIIFKPNKLPSALSLVVGLFFGVIFLLLPI